LIRLGHVDSVGVPIPSELDRGERVIPAEIHSANAAKVFRKLTPIDGQQLFRDREDAPAPERRYPLRARLALMGGIARNDARTLLIREVFGIIDDHGCHVAHDLLTIRA
jgi:hypothetical protein